MVTVQYTTLNSWEPARLLMNNSIKDLSNTAKLFKLKTMEITYTNILKEESNYSKAKIIYSKLDVIADLLEELTNG